MWLTFGSYDPTVYLWEEEAKWDSGIAFGTGFLVNRVRQ